MHDITERQNRTHEIRSFTIDDLETRDNADGSITFDGVASVVDTPYGVRDQFGEYEETIAPGAFKRTISHGSDVRLLKNHDAGQVFARTKSGTLELFDDPHLRAHAPSLDPANPAVQVLRSELKRGDIDQMSIGMRVPKGGQVWSEDMTQRTITEIALSEVSIVAFPASPTTSASVRSLDSFLSEYLADELDPDELRRAIAALRTPESDYRESMRRQLAIKI